MSELGTTPRTPNRGARQRAQHRAAPDTVRRAIRLPINPVAAALMLFASFGVGLCAAQARHG
ncbi:hypothetical protein ACPROK_16480 [Glutamicibacter soli]|uniref:hypothetical protein n=1 Tax=Micrococcaceae TaxID=1268 RepID=UPI003C77BAB7